LFAEKDAQKTYWAVVNKMPEKKTDTLNPVKENKKK